MLIVLSPLFVQLMHTDYYKIVKQLKSFKIIIVAPTCFGLQNHHQGALSLCFAKVTMLTSVTYRYMKLSVLWPHTQLVKKVLCPFTLYVCWVYLVIKPYKVLISCCI